MEGMKKEMPLSDMRSSKKPSAGGGESKEQLGLTEVSQLGPNDATTNKPKGPMGAPVCSKTTLPTRRRGQTFTSD